MKKLYAFIAVSVASVSSFAQNGQLPNGGFENWTLQTLYDFPTQWENSNTAEYSGAPTVVQSNDAQDGLKSCELRSLTPGSMGYPIYGYVNQGTPGESGFSYAATFDEVRFLYKSDISVDDSLYLILFRNAGGSPIDMQILAVAGGVHGTWTMASISVPAIPQEELVIAFMLSNPYTEETPDPGSWVRIDNVELYNGGTAQTAIADFSFEEWTTQEVETPDNWYTMNEALVGMDLVNADKTTDSYSGTYAIELTNRQDQSSGNVFSGLLSIADFNNNESMVPYSGTPMNFSGAFNYVPAAGSGDEGYIHLTFFEMGTPISNYTHTFQETAGYETFSAVLSLTGTPDSIHLSASAGNVDGSVLKLDDLSLSGGNVGLSELNAKQVVVFPNPATGIVTISAAGDFNWKLISPTGSVVTSGNEQQFSVEHLPSGIYFVELKQYGSTTMHQLVVR